jgi:hypothetical protein
MSAALDIAARVTALVADADMLVPASDAELARMRRCAPMNAELEALYGVTGDLGAPQFELFEPQLFIDVNGDDAALGEIHALTFFAADFGSSFFAVDVSDAIGLGEGSVFRADRGDMRADALVHCAYTLADFLRQLAENEGDWAGKSLEAMAEDRLMAAIAELPPTVEPGPPLDPDAFVTAREDRDLYVPWALAAMLEEANGLYFGPQRQIWRFEQMHRVPGAEAVAIGQDAALGTLAVTIGDWQALPFDRMFAFAPGQPPESGRLLGRTADVITHWIKEARGA